MNRRNISAPDAPSTHGRYSQAVEVSRPERVVFVSGQNPLDANGAVPESFGEQARLVWANTFAQLRAADMSGDDIVKVTTYLADRSYRGENAAVREEVLGALNPALTVVVCDIYDEAWLLEIEVVAAR